MNSASEQDNVTIRILRIVALNFLGYLVVGMQLSTLPSLVHHRLGYSAVMAGLVVSLQYLATLVTRSLSGRACDEHGPRSAMQFGLKVYVLGALLILLVDLLLSWPVWAMVVLLLARLAVGVAESYIGTSCNVWGIGRVEPKDASRVISWSGIATYSGLAVGSPLGVMLQNKFGFGAIGLSGLALVMAGLWWAGCQEDALPVGGERLPVRRVFGKVAPYGMGLALGGCGFGVIATFITLYYIGQHWVGAATTLSWFGLGFVAVRLVFAQMIPRYGGYLVAMASFVVEAIGLMLLSQAGTPWLAELGAIFAGMGFSLVYPALGIEVVHRLGASNRGASLAAYSVFVDVALGITGPLGGLLAGRGQYAALFGAAAACSVLALGLSLVLWLRYGRAAESAT